MNGFLLAEFERPVALLAAAEAAADAGLPARDALCPTPVEGLFELLASPRPRKPIGWIMFAAGVCGAILGYFMQWYSAVVDYPVISGGRPMNSWPNFIPVTFELTVLIASVSAFVGVFLLCRLPHPHHSVFNVPEFDRASNDRFFLCIEADDPKFDLGETKKFLESLEAVKVTEVKE